MRLNFPFRGQITVVVFRFELDAVVFAWVFVVFVVAHKTSFVVGATDSQPEQHSPDIASFASRIRSGTIVSEAMESNHHQCAIALATSPASNTHARYPQVKVSIASARSAELFVGQLINNDD